MSRESSQVPLHEVLELKRNDDGTYLARFPASITFSSVVLGDLSVAAVNKAALDFAPRSVRTDTRSHVDVLYYAVSFFRPVFPKKDISIDIKLSNAAKTSTVLHAELKQNGKVCLNGYITLSDLTTGGLINQKIGWSLNPPVSVPRPSFDALIKDEEPNWFTFHLPWSSTHPRQAQSYAYFCLPIKRSSPAIFDVWMAPAWHDDRPGGAVWTSDNIDVLMDLSLPTVYDLVEGPGALPLYSVLLQAAKDQRAARQKGKSDQFEDQGLSNDGFSTISTTYAISCEIKRRLPKEGCKWLFLRTITKLLRQNRTDYVMDLLDVDGNLIAIAQHAMQVIDIGRKQERPARI